MELYEVLNAYCSRNSGIVSKEDKRRHSYMLRRLFSSTYPIQCSLINNLNTEPVCASNIIALLSSRYSGLPDFLKIRVDQKKKKESIRKFYEDDVLSKYMEINQCGIRDVEEAYMFDKTNLDIALKLIKKTFFDNKDKVIVDKSKKVDDEKSLF